jgi:hypothetical protein
VVTFVLGFTWKGPTAFDVEEKGMPILAKLKIRRYASIEVSTNVSYAIYTFCISNFLCLLFLILVLPSTT